MSTATLPDDLLLRERFSDIKPPLEPQAAVIEANRCLNCFDAPCTGACPTHIDVPGFIKRISTGNLRGSALRILDANILGGSCAKACPVEVLCEGACVMHRYNHAPIQIGPLAALRHGFLSRNRRRIADRAARIAQCAGCLHRRWSCIAGLRSGTLPARRVGHHP